MKCNWCGKGQGKNYTRSKNGDIYYYYCIECIGFIGNELNPITEIVNDLQSDMSNIQMLMKWRGKLKK